MKKIIIFALMLVLTVTVSAKAQFKNAGELFQYWEGSDAYPDYVCGVWSTDGGCINLTVSVLDTKEGDMGKQEILDLIENDTTVTFVYGEYSYNYLRRVQDELEPYFGTETGLISSGVDVRASKVRIGILKEKLDSSEYFAMMEELREKYGDVFTVEPTSQIYDLALEERLPPIIVDSEVNHMGITRDYTVFVVICALLLFLLTVAVLRRRVAVTTTGDNVNEAPLTKKEVENMVTESSPEYPSELDEKIKQRLDK